MTMDVAPPHHRYQWDRISVSIYVTFRKLTALLRFMSSFVLIALCYEQLSYNCTPSTDLSVLCHWVKFCWGGQKQALWGPVLCIHMPLPKAPGYLTDMRRMGTSGDVAGVEQRGLTIGWGRAWPWELPWACEPECAFLAPGIQKDKVTPQKSGKTLAWKSDLLLSTWKLCFLG